MLEPQPGQTDLKLNTQSALGLVDCLPAVGLHTDRLGFDGDMKKARV